MKRSGFLKRSEYQPQSRFNKQNSKLKQEQTKTPLRLHPNEKLDSERIFRCFQKIMEFIIGSKRLLHSHV